MADRATERNVLKTIEEILTHESRHLGRGVTLVENVTIAGVTLVVYDCAPLDVFEDIMYERRFVVMNVEAGEGDRHLYTSGVVSARFERTAKA